MNTREIAERFHNALELTSSSPGFPSWDMLTEDYQETVVHAIGVALKRADEPSDDVTNVQRYFEAMLDAPLQTVAHDRNVWQRRMGVLMTLVETYAQDWEAFVPERSTTKGQAQVSESIAVHIDRTNATAELLRRAHRVVNTNPDTGSIDDPHADVARLGVKYTLEAAIAAGLVVPGPNAPGWMTEP